MRRTSAINTPQYLRVMSERSLAILGLQDVAYVTQVVVDGENVYSTSARPHRAAPMSAYG